MHKFTYSTNPAVIDQLGTEWKLTGYRNATEYTATTYEATIAEELAEVSRDNWRGGDIRAENPTTHTIRTENGGLLWMLIDEYGVNEYRSRV